MKQKYRAMADSLKVLVNKAGGEVVIKKSELVDLLRPEDGTGTHMKIEVLENGDLLVTTKQVDLFVNQEV